jgi:hypothetical protein
MTRDEMMARMSAREFREWRILEHLEPFGELARYIQAGIIASAMFNCQRSKESDPLRQPAEFIPDFDKDAQPAASHDQTPDQQLAMLMAFAPKAPPRSRKKKTKNG